MSDTERATEAMPGKMKWYIAVLATPETRTPRFQLPKLAMFAGPAYTISQLANYWLGHVMLGDDHFTSTWSR